MFPGIPAAEVRGCRFHLAQAWYRKLVSLGLQVTYNIGTSSVAVWLKTCFGMPCLPVNDITEFFRSDLCKILPTGPQRVMVNKLVTYLEKNYVNPASKFPPSMWAGCLDSDDMKNTTNGCENFHRHFGTGCLNPHPSIFDWLGHLSMTHRRFLIKSRTPSKQNSKSKASEEHLLLLLNHLNSKVIDKMTFVKLVSRNMHPFSPKFKSLRTKAMFLSIKRKYSRIVSNIIKNKRNCQR